MTNSQPNIVDATVTSTETSTTAQVAQPVQTAQATPMPVNSVQQPKKGNNVVVIILVVIGVLLLCCCGSFFALGGLGSLAEQFANTEIEKLNEEIEKTTGTESNIKDLFEDVTKEIEELNPYTVVENDEYSFYAPKEFEKSEMYGIEQYYQSKTMNAADTYNAITLTKTSLESLGATQSDTTNVDITDCNELSKQMVTSYAGEFGIAESAVKALNTEVIERNFMSGCKTEFEVNLSTGKVYVNNDIYMKDGNTNLYVVSTIFDDLYSGDSVLLNGAQSLFLLK